MADVIKFPQHPRAATGKEACAALQVLLAHISPELLSDECFSFRVVIDGQGFVLHGLERFGGRRG